MAKKQTRRSISFSIAQFNAAKTAAEHDGVALAQLAATALREYLERRIKRCGPPLVAPPHVHVYLNRRCSCGDTQPEPRPAADRRPAFTTGEVQDDDMIVLPTEGPPILAPITPTEEPGAADIDEVQVVYDEERA